MRYLVTTLLSDRFFYGFYFRWPAETRRWRLTS